MMCQAAPPESSGPWSSGRLPITLWGFNLQHKIEMSGSRKVKVEREVRSDSASPYQVLSDIKAIKLAFSGRPLPLPPFLPHHLGPVESWALLSSHPLLQGAWR